MEFLMKFVNVELFVRYLHLGGMVSFQMARNCPLQRDIRTSVKTKATSHGKRHN